LLQVAAEVVALELVDLCLAEVVSTEVVVQEVALASAITLALQEVEVVRSLDFS